MCVAQRRQGLLCRVLLPELEAARGLVPCLCSSRSREEAVCGDRCRKQVLDWLRVNLLSTSHGFSNLLLVLRVLKFSFHP